MRWGREAFLCLSIRPSFSWGIYVLGLRKLWYVEYVCLVYVYVCMNNNGRSVAPTTSYNFHGNLLCLVVMLNL